MGIQQEGTFRGTIVDAGFSFSKNKGTPQVSVEIKVISADTSIDGSKMYADIYFPEGNAEMCERAERVLKYVGWDGDYASLDAFTPNDKPVEFRVKLDSYQGRTQWKVDAVFPPGEGRNGLRKEAVAPDAKAAFVARMNAMRGTQASAPAASAKVPF